MIACIVAKKVDKIASLIIVHDNEIVGHSPCHHISFLPWLQTAQIIENVHNLNVIDPVVQIVNIFVEYHFILLFKEIKNTYVNGRLA